MRIIVRLVLVACLIAAGAVRADSSRVSKVTGSAIFEGCRTGNVFCVAYATGVADMVARIPDEMRDRSDKQQQAMQALAEAQQQTARVIHHGNQKQLNVFHQATQKTLQTVHQSVKSQRSDMEQMLYLQEANMKRMLILTASFMAAALIAVVAVLWFR